MQQSLGTQPLTHQDRVPRSPVGKVSEDVKSVNVMSDECRQFQEPVQDHRFGIRMSFATIKWDDPTDAGLLRLDRVVAYLR